MRLSCDAINHVNGQVHSIYQLDGARLSSVCASRHVISSNDVNMIINSTV